MFCYEQAVRLHVPREIGDESRHKGKHHDGIHGVATRQIRRQRDVIYADEGL